MAAKVLHQANPGFIEGSGVGVDALDKTVDALRVRFNKVPLQGGELFKTESPSGGVFKVSQYGTALDLPAKSEDSDEMPHSVPWKGWPIQKAIQNYRLLTAIERTFEEDQLMSVASRMAGGMMQSARTLLEYDWADVFNKAVTATATGADGVPLADDSHPLADRDKGTWDNKETAAALTHANYSTARKNMRKRVNEKGDPSPLRPTQIWVTPENEQKAREIFESEKVDDNSLNNKNVWKGEVSIKVYDWLTSTTAWFLWGNRYELGAEDRGLHYAQAVAPNIAKATGRDTSTDIIRAMRLRMRFVNFFSIEPNIQYNAGA